MMARRSRDATILKAFQKRFPDCWFKPGVDFDGAEGAVAWSGEEAEIVKMVNGIKCHVPAFNYYSWDEDREEVIWTMGVHNRLIKLADKFNCFWECQDPGTWILWRKG